MCIAGLTPLYIQAQLAYSFPASDGHGLIWKTTGAGHSLAKGHTPDILHSVMEALTANLLCIENRLAILAQPTHVHSYDFHFELYFECRHPLYLESQWPCVLRTGAIADYPATYADSLAQQLRLINTPQEHLHASELPHWYPIITDLTPQSIWADEFPDVAEIEQRFGWPVFIKGARQTSKHSQALSVARNAQDYERIRQQYRLDPILHWQQIIIREYVALQTLPATLPGKVPASVEFRTFWWFNQCVGWGPYWYQLPAYQADDIAQGLQLAQTVASRLNVPFLVVDIAKTADGRWIVIECNDAQESGYTGIQPQLLWRRILEHGIPVLQD